MKRILVVDDNSVCLSLAKSMLSDKYSVFVVLSGEQAIKFLEKKEADLILLDINMPEMSGFETLKAIRENPLTKNIPIIFLTSDTNPEVERKCFEMGALDFIVKPFQKATLRSRIARTLDLLSLQTDLEGQLLEKTKQIARISLKSMMMIATTVDKKDPLAADHSSNVAWFAVEIAKKMGWKGDALHNLQNLALVHDIGNIGVSDDIIRKKGPLTDEEYEQLKKHTTYGKNILQDMAVIQKAAEVAETHHERYDGKGYPNGLSGEEIPVESRIIAVADAFDSMTSDRSYRKKLSVKQLKEEFEKGRGTQFDPNMADIALEMISENRLSRSEEETTRENDIAIESSRLLQKVLHEYTHEVKIESQKDSLTGLWNKSYMEDAVNNFLTDKRHTATLFLIDIDCFSRVNEQFGHIAGDELIKSVSGILTSLFRSDDVICRLSGDKFLVFAKANATRDFGGARAEDIIMTLDNKIKMPGTDKGVSLSIGIATAPLDGTDFGTLFSKADKALYHVKVNGKHGYHFFSTTQNPVKHKYASAKIDLEQLHHYVALAEVSDDKALEVEYDSFKKIYRFLQRAQKRTKEPILILLLTLTDLEGRTPATDVMESAFFHLKNAVTTAIRSGDVSTNYSSSQQLVILVDSSETNGYLIAEHIRKLFSDSIGDMPVRLTYDLDSIAIDRGNKKN